MGERVWESTRALTDREKETERGRERERERERKRKRERERKREKKRERERELERELERERRKRDHHAGVDTYPHQNRQSPQQYYPQWHLLCRSPALDYTQTAHTQYNDWQCYMTPFFVFVFLTQSDTHMTVMDIFLFTSRYLAPPFVIWASTVSVRVILVVDMNYKRWCQVEAGKQSIGVRVILHHKYELKKCCQVPAGK